jgi:uncharacterized cupredoxin-like copper-binding protein
MVALLRFLVRHAMECPQPARITLYLLWAAMAAASTLGALAQESLVHGVWVWKTASVLAAPGSAETLRDFCRLQTVNEVYLSFSPTKIDAAGESQIAALIASLHRSGIRVEALLSSVDADEPGTHRDKLLDHVRAVLAFDRDHPRNGFDGIHLDVEPQQRPENKGPGNLAFLPNLLETYHQVRVLAEQNRISVNADIPNKFLKGDAGQRQALMSALPRLTLMLYELSNPGDGESPASQADKLRQESEKYLNMAYEGLSGSNLARMAIGLRTPDYESRLPDMLKILEQTSRSNPHYLGWAWHSYNDAVPATQ